MTNKSIIGLGVNHPANGPLTVERIIYLIEALRRSIQYQNGGDMAYVIADAIKGWKSYWSKRRQPANQYHTKNSTK